MMEFPIGETQSIGPIETSLVYKCTGKAYQKGYANAPCYTKCFSTSKVHIFGKSFLLPRKESDSLKKMLSKIIKFGKALPNIALPKPQN